MLYPAIVCRLKTQHLALREIIKNVDDQKLHAQPEPGKWSIVDQIAHLASYQPVFMGRMAQILKGENPNFGAYRADEEADFIAAQKMSLPELLNKIDGQRRQILELITNLNDEQLQLTGNHPKFGVLTIPAWTEFFLLHEAHHLFSIFKLVKG
ncbi:MAG: DinB family protein [Sphingobacteriales bacterium]